MTILACVLSYAGWTAVALAMDRHHRQVWHRTPDALARGVLRLAGITSAALAFGASIAQWGWEIGSVAWLGILSISALALVLLLAYAPRIAVTVAPLALIVATTLTIPTR